MRKAITALLVGLLAAPVVMAKGGGSAPQPSSMDNPFVITMVIIMLILLLAIALLANVVLGAASYYHQKEKERAPKPGGATTAALSVILLLMVGVPSFAQDAANATTATATAATVDYFNGVSPTTFYFMVGVVGVELLVVFILLYQLRTFLSREKLSRNLETAGTVEYKVKPQLNWWDKFNKFKPAEQEAQIDLGHDYDGIRELDNRLPPWWLYGFYACIVIAGIYLWRYHVSHTGPSSQEELAMEMKVADEQKAEYLKKSANNIDENSVKLLTDANAISGGQKVFTQNCKPCHGDVGQGIVGPNLTDDYWLHGGSIKDVFKTIKYGWPDKGMRSWKEDLSPMQIAQVASYIKSIHGTNPPNAKAPQGELFKETATGNSSSKPDSTTNNKVAIAK